MSIKGFAFRTTPGFVTDGANTTYVLSLGDDGPYPINRNGCFFGYVAGDGIQVRDRSSGVDPRLAGCHFNTAAVAAHPAVWRHDLVDGPGNYKVRLAAGDQYGNRSTGFVRILDTATPVLTIDHASGFETGTTWRDAADVERTEAAWLSTLTQVDVTFATAILNLEIGKYGAGDDGWIAFLEVEFVPGGGGVGGGAFHQVISRARGWGRWR